MSSALKSKHPDNMARRNSSKQRARPPRRRTRAVSRETPLPTPSIERIVETCVNGGSEVLGFDDPLEAEAWASAMLGTFYKMDVPWDAREELERSLLPAIVDRAEAANDAAGLAVLEALAVVADDEQAIRARAAAERMRAGGVVAPAWADELGSVVYEGAWMMTDVFGDHEAYYATFRYPGRKPHLVNALYDKAMGEIIKDGFVGYYKGDPRSSLKLEPGVAVTDADPAAMARRILDAIASGDMYLDNAWTPEFKRFRALIRARMRLLPAEPASEPPEPPDDAAREALISEFLTSGHAPDLEDAGAIASLCLDYSCDYLGEDGLRWSPIVVEQFMLDYLPRKVSLDMSQIQQLPAVLRAWVRFALTKRGLEERWIGEAVHAVDEFETAFRRAVTDADQFGPAKSIGNLMLAEGVDVHDQAVVERWIEAFNKKPFAERDRLLGGPKPRDIGKT